MTGVEHAHLSVGFGGGHARRSHPQGFHFPAVLRLQSPLFSRRRRDLAIQASQITSRLHGVRIRPGANRCGARWWRDINLLTAIAVNGTRSTFLEVNLTRLSAARPAHRPCRRPEEARLSTPGPEIGRATCRERGCQNV